MRLGRRQAAPKRVVLIPNQWNGSVQQYYHFLLGYLAPIATWVEAHPGTPIAVRDCGPMNRWFELLSDQADVEIMTVGDVLHILAGNLQPYEVLRGKDFPEEFHQSSLRRFADWTRQQALTDQPTRSGSLPNIVVSDRASHDEFFSGPGAEWPESGSLKRSVPNLATAVQSWNDPDVAIIDAAELDISTQIEMHSSARILIGQHGAGLTNMIWMPPGAHVIEILPPMPDDATPIFRNLAVNLGLQHHVVPQGGVHEPVDAGLLEGLYVRARTEVMDQGRDSFSS
ncbi:glycosyltransferase family 61 protein [Candidatus Nanopelagicales bacterium]|nr:glycosyltransferase family 61 protein [Candidatus Nanopelagicales bacterium]